MPQPIGGNSQLNLRGPAQSIVARCVVIFMTQKKGIQTME